MATPHESIAPHQLTLDRVVTFWAERRPHELALRYGAESCSDSVTWSEFDRSINGVADYLSGLIAKGATVGVVCDDSIDFHVLVNSIWRCGGAVLLIDRTWGAAIVEDLLALTNCPFIFSKMWPTQLDAVSTRQIDYPVRSEGDVSKVFDRSNPDDVAIYATTSGTTDNPKCVAISHRKIRVAYRTCLNVHDFGSIRCAASLFHVNSLGVLGVCFLLPREVGAATRAFPAFNIANIRQTWETLLNSQIDFVYLVPPLVRLLNTIASYPKYDTRLLAFCAAAPVRRDELRKLETKFPVTAFNAYGLTELTFAVFFGCRDDDDRASESIGLPVGIEARVADATGKVLDGTACGELHLKGPMLTDGYIHNHAATKLAWEDGWFKTGDIAERDVNDRYFIKGRTKDTILRGGVTYYLHELEHYLIRAPGVIDVCAFKGRDLPSGDELCVLVQAAQSTERADLLMWVRNQMGESKMPNILIVSHHALPRNSNGKVQRHLIARQYLNGNLN